MHGRVDRKHAGIQCQPYHQHHGRHYVGMSDVERKVHRSARDHDGSVGVERGEKRGWFVGTGELRSTCQHGVAFERLPLYNNNGMNRCRMSKLRIASGLRAHTRVAQIKAELKAGLNRGLGSHPGGKGRKRAPCRPPKRRSGRRVSSSPVLVLVQFCRKGLQVTVRNDVA